MSSLFRLSDSRCGVGHIGLSIPASMALGLPPLLPVMNIAAVIKQFCIGISINCIPYSVFSFFFQ